MENDRQVLLEIDNLKTYFFTLEGVIKAVNGVSLTVDRGKILGIVGESGCGKSVMSHSILGIVGSSGRIVEGSIHYYANPDEPPIDLAKLRPDGREIRRIRGREISMIFQEPMTSFSPVHTIGNQIVEAILLHQTTTKTEARLLAIEMLRRVGISQPEERLDSYPHQLSGGMRQRAMIAMALACQPKLLIADEPTTAVDVTIQAQILELIRSLQEEMGMSVIIITHDLGVIAEIADDVVVMYLGQVVERGSTVDVFYRPQHPYTQGLLQSIPRIDANRHRKLATIEGVVPDAHNIPPGCPFYRRCLRGMPGTCNVAEPKAYRISSGHEVACHLYTGGNIND